MKFTVTMKTPDALYYALRVAVRDELGEVGDDNKEEWADEFDRRFEDTRDAIASKWMPDGEYLSVEFDTETQTATVVPTR